MVNCDCKNTNPINAVSVLRSLSLCKVNLYIFKPLSCFVLLLLGFFFAPGVYGRLARYSKVSLLRRLKMCTVIYWLCLNKLLIGPRPSEGCFEIHPVLRCILYLDPSPHCEPVNCSMTWDSHFTVGMLCVAFSKDKE